MSILGRRLINIVYKRSSSIYRRARVMECFLMCSKKSHDPIYLPDGQTVVVGRSLATKIREKKMSRNQVELTADYKSQRIMVKQLGSNPSSIGSISLLENDTHTLGAGGKLNLLRGKYEHFIYFKRQDQFTEQNEPNKSEQCGKSNQKRKSDILDHNGPVKRLKTEDSDTKTTFGFDVHGVNDFEELKEEFGDSIVKEIKVSQDQKRDVPTLRPNEENTTTTFKPTTSCEWDEIEAGKLLVYKTKGLVPRTKIAGLDLDGTLITTKSGRVYATGPEDWKIKLTECLQKVQSLQNDGFKIVIFTNQGSIGRGRLSKEDFKRKVEKIELKLKVPFQLFAATNHGIYRKPLNGMWKYLVEKDNCGLETDKAKSFYVGDAAGRPTNWAPKEKKDFACSDRTFAENIGIPFFTPEEFFLNKKPVPFSWPEFNPKKLSTEIPLYTPQTAKLVSDQLEVIVLVGFPASGKTSFVKKHLLHHGYIHINRDTCGTWQKCVAMCKAQLSRKNSVVVDNTSPDKESRQRYIQPAKKGGVPVRCFVFDVSYEHAMHNNRIREILTTDKNYKSVGKMVFNTYRSSYQEPSLSEGFTEIIKINFIPNFESAETKDLYMQYSG